MIINRAENRARKFKAPTPRFGMKKNPRSLKDQQVSPYYWWWAYLRRSKQYIACCKRGGKGKLEKLYADFGDVRGDDFKHWWTEGERGRELFAEKQSVHGVIELKSKDEWLDEWRSDSTLIVAIPLEWSKRDLQKRLLALLRKRHTRGPGRLALKGKETSDARYPLARNFNLNSLKVDLAVYDALEASKKADERKTYYEIGVALKLVRSALPTALEIRMKKRAADKANTMTVAVSRAYTRAKTVVENVGKGVFP